MLTSIDIPSSVTSIGKDAFLYCRNLASITVASGNTVYDSREGCNAIIETSNNTLIFGCQNTFIPESITSIGKNAFYFCDLTSISIPSSVTSIGYQAFYCCEKLASVISNIEDPFPFGYNAFSFISSKCVLTIPNGTRDAYIAAGWTEEVFQGGIVESLLDINDFLEIIAPNVTFNGEAQTATIRTKDGYTALIEGTDYNATYSNNINVGTATVTLTGMGRYSGTTSTTFQITAKSAEGVTVEAIASQTYTGSALTPAVTVKDGETTLVSDTDYDAAYTDNTNVGTATVTLTFKGNYSGTKTATFQITAKSAEDVTVESIASQTYTGSALTPDVTVKDGETTLTSDDYEVVYANNTNVGTASVTLTFKGNYTGTLVATFTIGYYYASMVDDDDNTAVINTIVNNYGGKADVTLSGRKFFKDGYWNTICLPFDVTIADSPLAGADVRELNSAAFSKGTLTLNFTEVALTTIKAGIPYIIKWKETDDPIVDPVFEGATLSSEDPSEKEVDLGNEKSVTFKGIYAPIVYNETNNSVLLVDEEDNLYYPQPDGDKVPYINAFHAYFQLEGLTVGTNENSAVNAFRLNTGDATIVRLIDNGQWTKANEAASYYDLSGRRLEGQPTETGIYIVNGRKVIVK